MAHLNDFLRVLNGLSLVIKTGISTQGPKSSQFLRELSQHGVEISNTLPKEICLIISKLNDVKFNANEESQKMSQEDINEEEEVVVEEEEKEDENDLDANNKSTSDIFEAPYKLRERAVPSTPISRVFGFSSLAVGLAIGTASEITKRMIGSSTDTGNVVLSEQNADRLASTLCRMRGAALKLGQMLSIQDSKMLNPHLVEVLSRVRQGADIMPKNQLLLQLENEFGADWRSKFKEFDEMPIAAASIGQVHKGVLHDGQEVAVKIQYPGVADSIDSDILNLKRLVVYTNLAPKGLYLDNILKVAAEELTIECDYTLERQNQDRFREFVKHMKGVYVPKTFPELSTKRIITTELVRGMPIDQATKMSQKTRNSLASRILRLTLLELFEWRFMQTDPNWGNFLYDSKLDQLNLIDFGACRSYDENFTDKYIKIVHASAEMDEKALIRHSIDLGLLTGDESSIMLKAHVQAGYALGEPFSRKFAEGVYDWAKQDTSRKVGEEAKVFLEHRLVAPPKEVYSLHRRLSGAYTICIKLGAKINCRNEFMEIYKKYKFKDL